MGDSGGQKIVKTLLQNNRDLFSGQPSGPYIVDNNILASDYALDNMAQGGAYINNLFHGKMVQRKVLNRSTPYHRPHPVQRLKVLLLSMVGMTVSTIIYLLAEKR